VKITGIDHIGIAVSSLDEALEFYAGILGLRADAIEEKPQYGLRLVRLHTPNAVIELIEAEDWERTTQRYLERRGPGVYHVGVEVDDVDAAVADLLERRVRLIDEVPREGDGMRVSFIHPDATGGMLVEMVTKKGV
jgi:methylmalonyl-CoA/ethylmalonyl-CoA epimerase